MSRGLGDVYKRQGYTIKETSDDDDFAVAGMTADDSADDDYGDGRYEE